MTELIDDVGWMLLRELQVDARLSFRELGRRIGLSPPAVAERVRRMETAGIIKGYRVELDMSKIGLPITAMVRATPNDGKKAALAEIAMALPEVRECLRVTGSEYMWMKISAASLSHLDDALHQVWEVADTTTNVVLSTLVEGRPVTQDSIP
jgi:Lrp/AsnC family leucine-responsive transcriptional regulator